MSNFEEVRRYALEHGGKELLEKVDAARANQLKRSDEIDEMLREDIARAEMDTHMTFIGWLELTSALAAKMAFSAGKSLPNMTIDEAFERMALAIAGHRKNCERSMDEGAFEIIGDIEPGDDLVEKIKEAAKRGAAK